MEEVVEAAEAGCWVLWLGWVGLVIVMWCGIDAWKKEEGGRRRGEEGRKEGRQRGGGRQRVREAESERKTYIVRDGLRLRRLHHITSVSTSPFRP